MQHGETGDRHLDEKHPPRTPDRPNLAINLTGNVYTVRPDQGPILIGRELPADIRIDEPGISRTHVRIEFTGDCWSLTDTDSRNGTYLDSARIESVAIRQAITVHLGNPDGIAMHLHPAVQPSMDPPAGASHAVTVQPEPADHTDDSDDDSGIAQAGAAVAERREELGLSRHELTADDHVLTTDALAAFEQGRHWPGEDARSALEKSLRWPPGTLTQIRAGAAVPEDESTGVLSPTVQVALVVDAADIALRGVRARATMLPPADTPGFAEKIAALLSELRRLEQTTEHAVRAASGRPQLAATLGQVRRLYADLAYEAARSPNATFGQRLGAARLRARLTIVEAAVAAGVEATDITTAEADTPANPATTSALQQFVDILEPGLA